jgi:hypothetical protein
MGSINRIIFINNFKVLIFDMQKAQSTFKFTKTNGESTQLTKEQRFAVIEYAKELYCTVDILDGRKKYTYQQIANELSIKFGLKIELHNIINWASHGNWEKTFDNVKMAGIEKAEIAIAEKENKIIDEKSNIVSDIYSTNKELWKKAIEHIQARLSGSPAQSEMEDADAIKILQHAETIMLALNDKISREILAPKIIFQTVDTGVPILEDINLNEEEQE